MATVSPFLRNENILGLGNPVKKSATPVYLRSFVEQKFRVISILTLGFTVILRLFRKNFNDHYPRFGFSQFPFQGKSISAHSFWDIGMWFFCILFTTEMRKNIWEQNFEFLPQKFFTTPQSQKKIFKKCVWLWKALKNFWGKKIEIPLL